ncbi:hypothetical protein ACSIGC_08015 [Tenacibaculum sp. ZS6-P6]|uniref:hypothetical protein n=1 Tax=Tenacibaculum sp. ZS6-P6 TaxID=3447503 RepID=UPI003F963274
MTEIFQQQQITFLICLLVQYIYNLLYRVLYNVTGTGEVTILKKGNYLISGELSTTNMPSGDIKFILAVFINGVRQGYLSRGFASIPNQDFWGTTGTLMYPLNDNDIINI